MEKKQRIILISVLTILIVVLIVILLFLKKKPEENVVDNKEKQEQQNVISKPVTQVQNERSQISNTARGFVEIYGTFSNTNNYENIQSLYSFMTDKIKSKYEDLINNYTGEDAYYAKTTQVLSVSLLNYKNGDTTAKASVSVVEKIEDSTHKETVSQRQYMVSLVKEFNKWKVDEIK